MAGCWCSAKRPCARIRRILTAMNEIIRDRRLQFCRMILCLSVASPFVFTCPLFIIGDPSDDSAQDSQPLVSAHPTGHLIRVPLPITGEVDTRMKGMIDELLSGLDSTDERPILILEFRGDDGDGSTAGSQFERSLSLARCLAGQPLGHVRTIAYLSGSVQGHAVLPVLACEEIIAHPEAELGRAGIDEEFVDPTIRRGYSEIAERRRTVPVPVVLGMLDTQGAVYKVKTLDGVRYVQQDELEELKKNTAVSSVDKVIREGEMGNFSAGDLRVNFGFASHLARDRVELAYALRLPDGGIEEDPTLGEGRRAVRVDLAGPIKAEIVNWVERGIRDKIEQHGVNFVCLTINSSGGSPSDSIRLALYLASLDPGEVRTVAFIDSEARSDAALIALACDQLVMTDSAVLGGPGSRRIIRRRLDTLRDQVRNLAEAKQRGWSLPLAMVDTELTVHRCRRATGEIRHFCQEELAEQKNADEWQKVAELDTRSGLHGAQAAQVGLTKFTASDFEEIRRLYHLEDQLDSVSPNWAHTAIGFLASAEVAGALLFIGWFALMIEFMSPGLSLAGFASAVCFLLFFWANFLHGTAGVLEILLFAAGVACVALEIFIIPGLGAFGIGGALLIVASIVLATQTFVVPRNAYEWSQVPTSLFMVVAAGAGAFGSLIFMRRVLTEAPVFRRVSLDTPDDDRLDEIRYHESMVHRDHLVGKRGVTTTQLTPSGKARFGDDIIDVISDGDVISEGTDVYVENITGNEVLVRPLEG